MRIKLDENMPLALRDELIAQGHDADTCDDEGLSGQADPTVLTTATAAGRVLFTFDLDFGDVRQYPPGTHAGIVIFRLDTQDATACEVAAARLMLHVPAEDIPGSLIVVTEKKVRRHAPPP